MGTQDNPVVLDKNPQYSKIAEKRGCGHWTKKVVGGEGEHPLS